jgi:hypothetical protein
MGTMSASDAAPLPRLGEVFFDVRGNSRSMRLSWYADTGVAVLSIWQGGMCTGTFRLAIADLPRMVEMLQRGPGGQRPDWEGGLPGQAPPGDGRQTLAHVHAMPPPGEDVLAEQAAGPRTGAEYVPGPPPDDPRPASTQYLSRPGDHDEGPVDRGAAPDYPAAPPGHHAAPPGYPAGPPGRYPASPDYLAGPPGYRPAPPEYLAGSPGRPAAPDYPASRPDHRPAPAGYPDYLAGPAGYPGEPPSHRSDHWNRGDGGAYPRDAEGAGYREHPYSGGTGPADYPAESAPHYRHGTSASGDGDASRRSAEDYPGHYAAAVTDDVPPGPPEDSFPYGRPPAGRRVASRHAAPETPFD